MVKPGTYFLLCLIVFFSCNFQPERTKRKKDKRLVDASVLKLVKEGDVLLRYARGPFSEKIVEFMNEKNRFSHCGLAVKIDGKLAVIHSVSGEISGADGVQSQSLHAFASDIADSMFAILRPRTTDALKTEMAKSALYYLRKKTPFDNSYNTADSSELYCGELLYYTVGTAMGKRIIETKKYDDTVSLVMFNSFFNDTYFELIYSLKPVVKQEVLGIE